MMVNFVLWHGTCFLSMGYLLQREKQRMEKMSALSVISYKRKARHKTRQCPVPCSVAVYVALVILLSFVILTISNFFQSHFPLLLSITLMPNDEYRNEVKMILPSFLCTSWQFQTISIHSRVFYAVPHEVRKMELFQTVQV